MVWCSVPMCTNNRRKKMKIEGLKFHRFPIDEEKCNEWIKRIGRKESDWTMNWHICSWHFPNGKEAGPTRFHWNEPESLTGLVNGINTKKQFRNPPVPKPTTSQPSVAGVLGMSCAVPLCKNTSRNKPAGTIFHRFPPNEEECTRWIKLIRRDGFEWTLSSRICSWHFPEGRAKGPPSRFAWNVDKSFELTGGCLDQMPRRRRNRKVLDIDTDPGDPTSPDPQEPETNNATNTSSATFPVNVFAGGSGSKVSRPRQTKASSLFADRDRERHKSKSLNYSDCFQGFKPIFYEPHRTLNLTPSSIQYPDRKPYLPRIMRHRSSGTKAASSSLGSQFLSPTTIDVKYLQQLDVRNSSHAIKAEIEDTFILGLGSTVTKNA